MMQNQSRRSVSYILNQNNKQRGCASIVLLFDYFDQLGECVLSVRSVDDCEPNATTAAIAAELFLLPLNVDETIDSVSMNDLLTQNLKAKARFTGHNLVETSTYLLHIIFPSMLIPFLEREEHDGRQRNALSSTSHTAHGSTHQHMRRA
ncbi:hypothetical protein AC1031_004332 [Aphanomyces cochlioides]|nr:hypothetical protein AC1031_004332 [Aphanomyces cochlioides]